MVFEVGLLFIGAIQVEGILFMVCDISHVLEDKKDMIVLWP